MEKNTIPIFIKAYLPELFFYVTSLNIIHNLDILRMMQSNGKVTIACYDREKAGIQSSHRLFYFVYFIEYEKEKRFRGRPSKPLVLLGGRYWVRTSDPYRVKVVLYH